METTRETTALPRAEVSEMIEPEVVRQVRELVERGWGAKRIAAELRIARNTVRRYVRGGAEAESRRGRARRRSTPRRGAEAKQLFATVAEGNAVVVHRELAERGVEASVRTVQRAVASVRREQRVKDVATVRYETEPGQQMQIDFGQKLVRIGTKLVRVYVLVAVLSYSRRLFVRAFAPSVATTGARASPRRLPASAASRARCSATTRGRSRPCESVATWRSFTRPTSRSARSGT